MPVSLLLLDNGLQIFCVVFDKIAVGHLAGLIRRILFKRRFDELCEAIVPVDLLIAQLARLNADGHPRDAETPQIVQHEFKKPCEISVLPQTFVDAESE